MELVGFTKLLKPSVELQKYIKWIEEETKRIALIINDQDLLLPYGISSAFDLDRKFILVRIKEDAYLDFKGDIDKEEIEYMIAHEVTHGLLAYKEEYCQFRIRPSSTNYALEFKNAVYVFTMFEDIVVTKILYENNFQQYPRKYISQIEYEIECARVGKDDHTDDYKYMVFRYILIWGLLNYTKLDGVGRKKSYEYLDMFKKTYSKQYKQAIKVKDIICKNDISTAEGFHNTIEKCLDLDLWKIPSIEIITTSQALQLLSQAE